MWIRKSMAHWITGGWGRFFLQWCMNFRKKLPSVYAKSLRVKWSRTILQEMKSFLYNMYNAGKFCGLFVLHNVRSFQIHGNLPLLWWWTGFLTFSSGVLTLSVDEQSSFYRPSPHVLPQPLPQCLSGSLSLTSLSSSSLLSTEVEN